MGGGGEGDGGTGGVGGKGRLSGGGELRCLSGGGKRRAGKFRTIVATGSTAEVEGAGRDRKCASVSIAGNGATSCLGGGRGGVDVSERRDGSARFAKSRAVGPLPELSSLPTKRVPSRAKPPKAIDMATRKNQRAGLIALCVCLTCRWSSASSIRRRNLPAVAAFLPGSGSCRLRS